MCLFKPMLLALSTVALCACTTPAPQASLPKSPKSPNPPEMLMRSPLALRCLPSPVPLPATTSAVTKTPRN